MDKSTGLNLMHKMVAYILATDKPQTISLSGAQGPTGHPSPKSNHTTGMRRKAILHGRRRFKVNGKTRRVYG